MEHLMRYGVHVSTHSRPKAAGLSAESCHTHWTVSTHSRPKAAGTLTGCLSCFAVEFQHTAARRRLDSYGLSVLFCC